MAEGYKLYRNGSLVVDIHDQSNYFVLDHSDFGMPPVDNLTESSPMLHGEIWRSFRLRPRILKLTLLIKDDSKALLAQRRNKFMEYVAPTNTPLQLRYTNENNVERQVDCHYSGGLSFNTVNRLNVLHKEAISLYCPDPAWYDPVSKIHDFGLSGGGTPTPVPLIVPVTVGASTINTTGVIVYAGTWVGYPIIRIYGAITNPKIMNNTTGEMLYFNGYTIAGGAYYDIDCRVGYKTVVNNSGVNKIGELTTDSDLATFHLAPNPEAPAGENSITVTGTGASTATKIYVTYWERYLGA